MSLPTVDLNQYWGLFMGNFLSIVVPVAIICIVIIMLRLVLRKFFGGSKVTKILIEIVSFVLLAVILLWTVPRLIDSGFDRTMDYARDYWEEMNSSSYSDPFKVGDPIY